jgi:hypothetical protein
VRARAVIAVCCAAAASVLGCAASSGRAAPPRASAVPPIAWGVADDMSKYSDDGGAWFYGMLKGANLTENRWTLAWDPANPSTITELPFVQRAAPKAQQAGIHVVLALYSKQASQHDPDQFCAWAATVASTVRQWGIHDYIVWNEPNTRLYWVPQKDDSGNDVAAAAYEQLLAKCYDTLHAADPLARVIGFGLSPRASTSESTEPLVFLRDVGAAYRASGRTTPIMDQLSIHPYPNPSAPTSGPDTGYQSPDRFGIPDLARVKQAVWDAFNGTGQPTTLNGLTFRIDEVGWQTDTSTLPQYVNPENVPVVSEQTQADDIKTMATKYFACDPAVTDVELFLLVDEKYRNGKDETGKVVGGGWQSGLLTAGGEGVSQPKLAYSQDGPVFGKGRAACAGPLIAWTPAGVTTTAVAPAAGGTTWATLGDPDGLLDPSVESDLEAALANAAQTEAQRPALAQATAARLLSTYKAVLDALLAAAGQPAARLQLTGNVVACAGATPRSCTAGGALAGPWKAGLVRHVDGKARARYTTVAAGTASIRASRPLKLTLKPAPPRDVQAPAGTYYLVAVLTSRADPSVRYGFAVQARSVKAAKGRR